MTQPFIFLIAALFLSALVPSSLGDGDGTPTPSTEPPTVVSLTAESFDSFIEKQNFTVVEFFAPWCGHCKRLAPEYEAAAKVLKEEGVLLASVDATVESELASRFDIAGYPTLKAFRKGKAEDYKGGRTRDAIVQWVRRMTGESVVEVTSRSAAEEVAASAPVAFIGRFKSKETDTYKTFHATADDSRQLGKFIAVISDDGDDTVFAVRTGEDPSEAFKMTDAEAFKKFLDLERFPLFGEINASNYAEYFQSSRDVIWFAGVEKDFKNAQKVIRESAKESREKANYVWLNTTEFKDHAEMALGVRQFPALVVQRTEGRYIFGEHTFDSSAKVTQFVKDVYDGKVEKNLISEDVPETNDEAVKVVVGKTFIDMVLQPEKDVFLEIYAPWCGHCKQFEPVYAEFAESVKDHQHVLVAKMDGTKNESPHTNFRFSGFPTVFFVKAGTTTPLIFDGPRTVEGLTQYLNEHGSKPVSTSEEPKDEL